MQKVKHIKGFTLIELLVVIAIVGILSAFFVNNSTINLKRGRDARRKSDLAEIQSAIETYRADCNKYPSSITYGSSLTGDNSTPNCLNTNTYLSSIPQDPQIASGNTYVYSSNGVTYQICSTLEAPVSGASPYSCNGSVTSCGGNCYYQVYSP